MSRRWSLWLVLLLHVLPVHTAHAKEDQTAVARAPSLDQLPPWPGPMPRQFVDVYAYEATLRSHLSAVNLRAAGLSELGRPPSGRRVRLAGWLTAGAGLTVGMIAYAGALETTNEPLFRGLVVTGLVGGVACLTGLAMVLFAPRNPYRHEIRELQREGERLNSELQRLRWERMAPQLVVSRRGVTLQLRF